MTSTINILGLALGLTIGIVIMLWTRDEVIYDQFHTNLKDVFILMKNKKQDGNITTGQATAAPLAAAIRNEIPEVRYAAHVSPPDQQLIRYKDKNIYEKGIYAEPDFFRIMRWQAVEGDPVAALNDAGSVVITESTAKKMFGDKDPVGKPLVHNNTHQLTVGAVIRDIPTHSSLQFDIALPFRIFQLENPSWITRWDYNALLTWVELRPNASVAAVNGKLRQVLNSNLKEEGAELFVYPLADLHLHGEFRSGKPDGGRIEGVVLLAIIGIAVLLIACFNFMNLSTAHAANRSREVGVRKTLGARRKQIIYQFMVEAALVTGFALVLGALVAKLVLPGLNQFFGKDIQFDLLDGRIWLIIAAIGVVTSLVAGSYPAFFLSGFRPALVLKGLGTVKKTGAILRTGLVIFQFVISIFLITCTIVIFKQQQYVQARPLGYEQENLIDIPARADMAAKFRTVKTRLLEIPGVKSVSGGSDDLVRFGGTTTDISWPGKLPTQNFPVTVTNVQYDWTRTAGLVIKEGRDFGVEYPSDTTACLVNEAAVSKMGLKEPVVGLKLGNSKIVGVVKNFVYDDPFEEPRPLVAYLSTGNLSHFFVRINNDNGWSHTLAQIGEAVKSVNPDYPFEFHFTKEEYQQYFTDIQATSRMMNVVGLLAIFVSCLGLFGLSVFLAEKRAKEISIRKVLGASTSRIWYGLSREFLKPVVIAIVVATPLAAWAMETLLLSMQYHIGLSWWMFAISGVLALLIALITVSFQGIKAALTNPIRALRSE